MRELNRAVAVQSEPLVDFSTVHRAGATTSPTEPPTSEARGKALPCAAQSADERGLPGDIGPLWHALVSGELEVLDAFYTTERWFIVMSETAPRSGPRRSSARCRSMLGPLLFGQRQKVTAIEKGVAPSTVCAWLHQALADIGVALSPRKAPAILALLARAGTGLAVPDSRVSNFVHESRACLAVSIERPELQLAHKLPRAEYAVLCGIIEGRSYADLATERGTSTRTIANQVASLFHRLGVSGRGELISFLLGDSEFQTDVQPAGVPNSDAPNKSLFATPSLPARSDLLPAILTEATPSTFNHE